MCIIIYDVLHIIIAIDPLNGIGQVCFIAHREQSNGFSTALFQVLQNIFVGITTIKMVGVIEYIVFWTIMYPTMKPKP